MGAVRISHGRPAHCLCQRQQSSPRTCFGSQREFAIRAAIGADRGRLIRQAFTESLVLALTGCVLGCGLARIILRVIVGIAPHGIPRLEPGTLGIRSLVFAVGVSVISTLIFGLTPALVAPVAETLVQRGAAGRGLIRQ